MKKLNLTQSHILFLIIPFLFTFYSCRHETSERYDIESEIVCCPINPILTETGLESRGLKKKPITVLPIIELTRTGCFGYCPVYYIKVFEDGNAYLSGLRHLPLIGEYKAKISNELVQEIRCKALDIGFYDFDNTYPDESVVIYDLPSVITTISSCNTRKTIEDRHPSPDALRDFEEWLTTKLMNLSWEINVR